MKKEREELIVKLLMEGKNLVDIRIQAQTSPRVIQKVIDDNNLREHRKELKKASGVDITARMNTPKALEKRRQTYIRKKEEKRKFGSELTKQKALDEKVKAIGYNSCFEYIQLHGALSFRKNILKK